MSEETSTGLDAIQKQIFEKLAKNDNDGFKHLVAQLKGGVDFVDDTGMSPMQHACYKGNKDAVIVLLDMGADINFNKHGANYSPLHFAALSGKPAVCRVLLDAGISPTLVNSIHRTASQMAAFVGNYICVETINNYIPRSQLEGFTQPQEQQTVDQRNEPLIPPEKFDAFHNFVVDINLHPVRIVLNLQEFGLLRYMPGLRQALQAICDREMKKSSDVNQLMAFKYHYLSWIVTQLMKCEDQCKAQRKEKGATEVGDGVGAGVDTAKNDFVELFIKRVLKENKVGQLDYVEYTIRECVREFPYRECTIFRQVVTHLGAKDPHPALIVLRNSINGLRGFSDESAYCSSCGNDNPDKKCSKCKAVQYCDRECQRLHWFVHKKTCSRPGSSQTSIARSAEPRMPIDTNELREELAKMTTK